MIKREKFSTRVIILAGESQKELAAAMVRNAPMGIEIVAREIVKARKPDQNSAMWSGPLLDIASQGYINGRTYSAEVWHEQFKREYLPEEFDEELCKEGYRKWDYTPSGDRVLIGSTTKLTIKGFARYLQQVEAFGASLGVLFHANPNDYREAA